MPYSGVYCSASYTTLSIEQVAIIPRYDVLVSYMNRLAMAYALYIPNIQVNTQ